MNKKETEMSREIKTNKKLTRRAYSNQKGITLIALVIIMAVVLLILVGVTIFVIFSNGEKNNKVQGNRLNENIGENDKNLTIVSTKDTAPYYPDYTFTMVEGTDLSSGLVIKDASGNEYVWIEVPRSLYNNKTYNTETSTADKKPSSSTDYDKIEYCLKKYANYYREETEFIEPDEYSDTYCSDEATGLTQKQYYTLKQKMLKSVYENGGFWIGRYEAGIEISRTQAGKATAVPLSKAGTADTSTYPYTYVTCSQAQTLVAQLAIGKSYTSSLMFGIQWDLVLKHIEVKEVEKGVELETIQDALTSDSKEWGNYCDASFEINRGEYRGDYALNLKLNMWHNYNSESAPVIHVNGKIMKVVTDSNSSKDRILLTTGASEACKKLNIYDLAGNVAEWTLENNSDPYFDCTSRGGDFEWPGIYAASYRNDEEADSACENIGFRASIYK